MNRPSSPVQRAHEATRVERAYSFSEGQRTVQVIKNVIEQNGMRTTVTNPKTAYASAAGKAIICGEHAVVYGATAVALPLTAYKMQADLRIATDVGSPVRVILGDQTVSENIAGVVHDAFEIFGIEPFALTLEGKSHLPIGAGLGSSATLCVVVVRALSAAIGIKLTPYQVAIAANQLEKRFHGRPSGLDTSVVAYEQVISFRSGEAPRPLEVTSPWRFALIDSRVRASTITMIRQAEPYFKGRQGTRRVAEFDHWSQQVVSGLSTYDEHKVSASMQATGDMLREAGLVPDALQVLIEQSYECGALAAKITGAGGGGAVLALLPKERSEAEAVLTKLRHRLPGYDIFDVEI